MSLSMMVLYMKPLKNLYPEASIAERRGEREKKGRTSLLEGGSVSLDCRRILSEGKNGGAWLGHGPPSRGCRRQVVIRIIRSFLSLDSV